MMNLRRALVGSWSLVLVSCGGSLPVPEATQHPLSAYAEVPYPPPAALAETVPPPPDGTDVVWVDGEWVFHGKSFVWRRGGWVQQPAGGRYARWRVFYRRDVRLMMAQGGWYDAKHEPLSSPSVLEPAATPPNEVTPESQTGR